MVVVHRSPLPTQWRMEHEEKMDLNLLLHYAVMLKLNAV